MEKKLTAEEVTTRACERLGVIMNTGVVVGQVDCTVEVHGRLPSGLVDAPFQEHLLQQQTPLV